MAHSQMGWEKELLKNKVLKGFGLGAGYTVMALVMTWPLVRYFGSFVAADAEDGAGNVWTLWWTRFSLLDLRQNPLNCQYLFFPDGVSVIFNSFPKALALVSIPLQFLFGLTAAYNITFLLTFVGSGVAAYFLIRHLTGERLPAFLAGALFAFSPARWGQWSHQALLSTMMVPLYMLALVRAKEALDVGGKRPWLLFGLAGFFLGIQSYETEHYTISLLLLSGVFLIFNLVLSRTAAALKKWLLLVLGQAVAVFISTALFLPMLIAAYREIAEKGDYVTFPIRDTLPGIDLVSFIPTFGQFFTNGPSALGFTVLVLAYLGLALNKNRQKWFWAASALVFATLALGAYLVINGETYHIAGPFWLLQKIPLLNSTRVPGRFVLFTTLSLSVLSGYGISAILSLVRRQTCARMALPAFTAAVLVLLFIEYWPTTVSLTSTSVPPVYEEIAQSDVPGSVVILPLGWISAFPSGTGLETVQFQLYQPVHKRPMVGGLVARVPKEPGVKGVYTPVIDYLVDPQTFAPSGPDLDPDNIRYVMEKYQIAFIVIQKRGQDTYSVEKKFTRKPLTTNWSPETFTRLDNYITSYLGMEKFESTDEYVAYRRR